MSRWLIGAVGVAVAAYGMVLLLQQGLDNLVATVIFAAIGVFGHDAVLAPAFLVLAAVALAIVPAGWRAAVAGGAVVLGTVTVVAIPVLGRFGARSDNPTLLPRDYTAGWLVLAAVVVLGVVAAGLLHRRREPR